MHGAECWHLQASVLGDARSWEGKRLRGMAGFRRGQEEDHGHFMRRTETALEEQMATVGVERVHVKLLERQHT